MSAFKRTLRTAACALCCGFLLWANAAESLSVEELQRMLQRPQPAQVRFEEVRESPWLSRPAVTRGTMHSTPQALEKRIEEPRRETWRLLPDRMEWIGADGTRKEILFTQAPPLAALADVLRRCVAGDLAALERDFRITLQGSAGVWSARMHPRRAELGRQLESVELQGTGSRVQVIIVNERNGERTTTRLSP